MFSGAQVLAWHFMIFQLDLIEDVNTAAIFLIQSEQQLNLLHERITLDDLMGWSNCYLQHYASFLFRKQLQFFLPAESLLNYFVGGSLWRMVKRSVSFNSTQGISRYQLPLPQKYCTFWRKQPPVILFHHQVCICIGIRKNLPFLSFWCTFLYATCFILNCHLHPGIW